jgi:hypothetical protein
LFLLWDFAVIPLAAKGWLAVTSLAPIQYTRLFTSKSTPAHQSPMLGLIFRACKMIRR